MLKPWKPHSPVSRRCRPFESWEADAWPPAADLIRLHTRLLQGRNDVAQERAASFLAEVLAQYDARYAALREDFASLERLTSVGTWKYDVRQQRLSWSDRALEELGMSREEALTDPNMVIAHFVHPDDREQVAAALFRTITEGTDFFSAVSPSASHTGGAPSAVPWRSAPRCRRAGDAGVHGFTGCDRGCGLPGTHPVA